MSVDPSELSELSPLCDLRWPPGLPRQRALHEHLRGLILRGVLRAGARLPASRVLAPTLGVARNTVLHAYAQLQAEGYLQADRHGTRVAALPVAGVARAAAPAGPGLSRRAAQALAEAGHGAADLSLLPLALGVPDLASFPLRAWRASLDRAWRQAGARQLGYAPPGGEPVLRSALAGWLSGRRGMALAPEQVVVTSGTQGALDLCARLLADEGDTAWVEDPGYGGARTAFALAGLRVHPVPVDAEGLAPSESDWALHPPRLIFVTPAHQFPTGAVMPLARRLALVERARTAGAWIIEDDYESEFWRAGTALPALAALQPHAPVVHALTFSKTLLPTLRLGCLGVPAALAADFARAAGRLTRPGQGIEQRALADFLERGRHTVHLRRMRTLYAGRRDRLCAALQRHLLAQAPPAARLTIRGGDAGLHLLLAWTGAPDEAGVAARAQALGVAAQPLGRFRLAPAAAGARPEQGLVLGYGATPDALIDGAVERLALAFLGAIVPTTWR